MKTEQWLWSADNGWNPGPPSEGIVLGTSAQVVLFFGSTPDLAAGRCFDVMHTAYPRAHLFGCTTGGEIHGTHITDNTVTMTAIAFAHSHVVPAETAD